MSNISRVQFNGVEYNLLDKEAQAKIAELKENTYTKSEVDELLDSLDDKIEGIDLTPYETKEGAAEKYQPKGNYLTEHQSLENYYTKEEVDQAIENVDVSDQLENYATKEYVDSKVDGIDLTGYAKKSDVESAVKAGIDSIVDGATEAMDTLKEVEEALKSSESTVEALNQAIGSKADKDEVYSKEESDVKFADYYNRKEIDDKIDAVERKLPDLTPYAKIEYVDSELIEFGKTIYKKEEVDEALSNKVDKEDGKGLSSNDFTNEDKAKLDATPSFWIGTQAEYDSLEPKPTNTFFYITDDED